MIKNIANYKQSKIDWSNQEVINNLIIEYGKERIELWKTYLNNHPDNDLFAFMDDVIISLINKKEVPIKEINALGGRKGQKTYLTIEKFCAKLIAISIKYDLKIAIYGFRKYGADIQELRQEIDSALELMGLEQSDSKHAFKGKHYIYKGINNVPKYTFVNGSFIQLKGLYKSSSNKITLKGLASCNGFDIAISINEEANEIKEEEFQAVDMAIRGAKQYLKVKLSNPDSIFEYFVAYCNERLKQDKHLLETYGYQIGLLEEHNIRKIFIYTNYTINPYLTKDEILEFKQLKELDPHKYSIWGLGLPGSLNNAVFDRYVEDKELTFNPQVFTAGIDLGQADTPTGHPTRAIFIGMDQNIKKAHPLDEYIHSNATMEHKDPHQIANDLIRFFMKQANKYPTLRNGLNVKVDYGAGGAYMIDILEKLKYEVQDRELSDRYGIYKVVGDWLTFQPVDKSKVWYIKDRVDITITFLSYGILTMSLKDTPELFKEMKLIKWLEPKNDLNNSNYKLTMLDKGDDGWDAMMYGLMEYAATLKDNLPKLYDKRRKTDYEL